MKPTPGEVHSGLLDTGHRLQAILDQPDTSRTVNPLHHKVDIANLAQAVDKLFLDFIQVIESKLFGEFRRWGKWCSIEGTPIEAFEACGIYRLTNGFTAGTAEFPWLTFYLGNHLLGGRNRQATVKTGLFVIGIHSVSPYYRSGIDRPRTILSKFSMRSHAGRTNKIINNVTIHHEEHEEHEDGV